MDIAIAPAAYAHVLEEELALKGVGYEILAPGTYFIPESSPDLQLWWAAQHWRAVVKLSMKSISDGVKQLLALRSDHSKGAQYYLHPTVCVRRMMLMGERLHLWKQKEEIVFPAHSDSDLPAVIHVTMADQDHLYYALPAQVTPSRPAGLYTFAENRLTPPNRAYLKLWEFFTRSGRHPLPSQCGMDLGSSPGGWTWVIGQFASKVISVDKADLDPKISKGMSNVSFLKQSAFALNPKDFQDQVDWLFCDIIAYPGRSVEMMERWVVEAGVKNFVCTLKFQSQTDFAAIKKALKLPGSHVVHLHHNKHELTWYKCP